MIDPQPPDADFDPGPDLTYRSDGDSESEALDRLQEDAEDEYGILPLNAVLAFWLFNTLGAVAASTIAGGLLYGLLGAFTGALLGGVAYGASALISAYLTGTTGGRLSRTVAVSAGVFAAAWVLNTFRPVEPVECVAALAAGTLGAGISAIAYREYLASAYHCPRYRFALRDLLVKMAYVAVATAVAGHACNG